MLTVYRSGQADNGFVKCQWQVYKLLGQFTFVGHYTTLDKAKEACDNVHQEAFVWCNERKDIVYRNYK